MLYLAEVKKQSRTFLGGMRTELKLIACQHSDQTWSALPGEEVLVTEEMEVANEGTLWVLKLTNNRQLEGKPDIAAPQLVGQLQKLSRLSEKLKDQQSEIERWKQSLTYQSQELGRRAMEIEARETEVEEREVELTHIELQKYEVEQAWNRLESERNNLQSLQQRFGSLLQVQPEYQQQLQFLLQRLIASPDVFLRLNQALSQSQQFTQQQQRIFNACWQELDQYRQQLSRQESELHQGRENLAVYSQELSNADRELEKAKLQLVVKQNALSNQQQLLSHWDLEIQSVEALQTTLYRLATGSVAGGDHKVDLQSLEQIPLGELEELVKQLQSDLDKIVRFVNDQEEELTMQCETVDELQAKLAQADDYGRLTIEETLAEEQERKRMLDETLVGQRRNLKERQDILLQHLLVLRRRQGIIDLENALPNINLDPAIAQLEARKTKVVQERDRLASHMQQWQGSLSHIEEMVRHLEQDHRQKHQSLEQEEQRLRQLEQDLAQIQAKVQLYERTLQPLQNQLNSLKPQVECLTELLTRRGT